MVYASGQLSFRTALLLCLQICINYFIPLTTTYVRIKNSLTCAKDVDQTFVWGSYKLNDFWAIL